MVISLKNHFDETRKSLVTLYENSQVANHGTVQGSLREGFVRSVLQGHVGDAVAWSTGQIVTTAPSNKLSGQLDLIAHRGADPQVYIQDQFLRLIPSAAVLSVVEVKSDLTTGDMTKTNASSVLKQALDTFVCVRRTAADLPETVKCLGGKKPVPTFLVAYKSGQLPNKIIEKTANYLKHHQLKAADFWPTAIIVLKGPKKYAGSRGYGLFQSEGGSLAAHGSSAGTDVPLRLFGGGDALAALVCQVVQATGATFDLVPYVFDSSTT